MSTKPHSNYTPETEPKQERRDILFTCADGQKIRETNVALPGPVLNPPKTVVFLGRVFQYRGSGVGRSDGPSCNFYHEIEAHRI